MRVSVTARGRGESPLGREALPAGRQEALLTQPCWYTCSWGLQYPLFSLFKSLSTFFQMSEVLLLFRNSPTPPVDQSHPTGLLSFLLLFVKPCRKQRTRCTEGFSLLPVPPLNTVDESDAAGSGPCRPVLSVLYPAATVRAAQLKALPERDTRRTRNTARCSLERGGGRATP